MEAEKKRTWQQEANRVGRAAVKTAAAVAVARANRATSSTSVSSGPPLSLMTAYITALGCANYPKCGRDMRRALLKCIDIGDDYSVSLVLNHHTNMIGSTLNYRESYTRASDCDDVFKVNHLVERSEQQSSPLMACINSSAAPLNKKGIILHMLLRRGANPNETDDDGETPLHIISGMTSLDTPYGHCVRALMLYGADAERTDANGDTPLAITIKHMDGPSHALIESGAEFIVDPSSTPTSTTSPSSISPTLPSSASNISRHVQTVVKPVAKPRVASWTAFVSQVTTNMLRLTPTQTRWARRLQASAINRWRSCHTLLHDVIHTTAMVGMIMMYIGAPFDIASIPSALVLRIDVPDDDSV